MGSKRKHQKGQPTAYFIRRKSHVDDTQFVHDEGHRIAFGKVTHASWFMRLFDDDQGARIVKGPTQPGDVRLIEVLPKWLPDDVKPQEYLAAIEQTTADVLAGRELPQRAVRTFLKSQKQKAKLRSVEG